LIQVRPELNHFILHPSAFILAFIVADKIQLEVVTPERRVLSEAVDGVQVPGLNGELGILPGHVPLISQLQTGVLSYTQGGTTQRLHVSGGFVEVNGDRVSVLAEVAERPEEIDAARARLAREHAEKSLSAWSGTEEDFEVARARLERSMVRLQLATGAPIITP
jgi:F-type H+-transporting ATPase subunit epsilon